MIIKCPGGVKEMSEWMERLVDEVHEILDVNRAEWHDLGVVRQWTRPRPC
jgi:hypothetical protein